MTSAAVQQAMAKAIALASKQHPHPNPRVGAVILGPDDRELGAGAHVGPGLPHAEPLAIANAGLIPEGATLVVTLEPCDHTGRTPPCTEAIIEAGIKRVVVGALDPDSDVDGAGIRRLRAHGIEVAVLDVESDLAAAAVGLDPGYFHHRRYGRPQVILKLAATLDGQVAATDGTSQWITGPGIRRRVHHWRSQCDAVMVGAGTVMADDPRLDVRLDAYSGRQPRPVIVAGSRPLPPAARIWERDPLVLSSVPIDIPAGELAVVEPEETGTRVDLASALARLGSLGVLRLLVEGGPAIASSLMAGDHVDIGLLHLGAKFAVGLGRPLFEGAFPTMEAARDVEVLAVDLVDGDLEVRWQQRRG